MLREKNGEQIKSHHIRHKGYHQIPQFFQTSLYIDYYIDYKNVLIFFKQSSTISSGAFSIVSEFLALKSKFFS